MVPEAKVRACSVCGEDCTGTRYIKDSRGRYYHEGRCVATAKQRAAAAGAAARGGPTEIDPTIMAMVDEALATQGDDCPSCENPMIRGSMVCISCGYNMATGKVVATRVHESKKTPLKLGKPKKK